MSKLPCLRSIPLASILLVLSLASASAAAPYWVASWAASPAPASVGGSLPTPVFQNETVREIVHLSAGGDQVRVRLTNRYGKSPLTIGAATVALRAQGSTISPDTLQTLNFGGQPAATIPPGADILSDPVSLAVQAQAELAISLYLPDASPADTVHSVQRSAVYTSLEDQTSAANFSTPVVSSDDQPWVWLDGVDVSAAKPTPVIAAFGDSITDGYRISRDTAHDWPILLSQRLQQQAHDPGAVVNAGIGGNRVLADGTGPSASFGVNALARFDADVLAQSSVRIVIVLLGINDIGLSGAGSDPGKAPAAHEIEWGLTQIAERAHAHGLKIYVATLTPFAGADALPDYYSAAKEQTREDVNTWIRHQGRYDGFVDFDKLVSDPQHPHQMLVAYDSGDHLHPNDAGDRAMANAIPLSWFK